MKIKYNWIVLAIAALASLSLGVWQSVVAAEGGEFFLSKSTYAIIIFGITVFAFIVGAVLTVLDRETPKTYNIGKNFFAGFFGLLVSVCYISYGLIGFTELSGQGNVLFFVIVRLMEIFGGAVFLMEAISSFTGRNLLKRRPILTIAVPIMFAFRLIELFFEYTRISVQSSEMFDIVAVAFACMFMYYHAVMFARLKKSCVKSLYLFSAPMICVCLASGIDIVVKAVLLREFTISNTIIAVSDILLCFYAVSILAELTRKAGKQYLSNNSSVDELAEVSADKPEKNKEIEDTDSQSYSSFEEIDSFGKSTPHIRRETILSAPAANVEPKAQDAEVALHADALHEALTNNFELNAAADSSHAIQEQTTEATQANPEKVKTEEPTKIYTGREEAASDNTDSLSKDGDADRARMTDDTESVQKSSAASDGVDMDRINRLLSEFEQDN